MPGRMVIGAILAWLVAGLSVILWGVPALSLVALSGATLVVEYAAAAVGVGVGLSPLFLIIFIMAFAFGMIFILFALFDALATSSARVCRFLEHAQQKHGQSRLLRKYGILSLVPLVIIIGFYFTPPVAWFMGWDRRWTLILLGVGEVIGILITLALTYGVLRIFGIG
ncbi:MAG: hypothetical protein LUQ40_01555 [Methanomicrobiales archaeon]|nr:hypothetical protein [Methanomicrobiales archaeon]